MEARCAPSTLCRHDIRMEPLLVRGGRGCDAFPRGWRVRKGRPWGRADVSVCHGCAAVGVSAPCQCVSALSLPLCDCVWVCVHVGSVADVVECGLPFESRCVWADCPACAVGVVPSVRLVTREAVSVGVFDNTLVSSCRCCVLVSCVHTVAILFCTICGLSMFVSDALG